MFLSFGFCQVQAQTQTEKPVSSDFECVLTASKQMYSLGEVPELQVAIVNNSGEDVYLIGSLDGSEEKWRMPFCYYTIEKPQVDSLDWFGRCGMMNNLKVEDFVQVPSGGSFNPLSKGNGYNFYDSFELRRVENFRNTGTYKITFHYSTNSDNIKDYLGLGLGEKAEGLKSLKTLNKLLMQVPKIELQSNTVEIEVVE